MVRIQLYILILALSFTLSAEIPQKFAFKDGEKLFFEAAYNLNFIWVPAGEAVLSVKTSKFNNKQVFGFEATGTSLQNYDWFFKVRNKYTAYADDQTLNTFFFERIASEGSKEVYERYNVDPEKKQIFSYYKFNKKPLVIDTLYFKDRIFDALTAAYYMRSLDFTKIKKDEKIYLPVIIDNKLFPMYIRYMGKDVLVSHDKHFYNCHKFSALVMEGTIFKGGEDVFVWVSDDDNHVPIQVEAKIIVGSIKIQLKRTENLSYPFKAFIK